MAWRKRLRVAFPIIVIAVLGIGWYAWPRDKVEIVRIDSTTAVSVVKGSEPTVFNFSAAIEQIQWSPDSKSLIIATKAREPVKRRLRLIGFEPESKSEKQLIRPVHTCVGMALSNDGTQLFACLWRSGPGKASQLMILNPETGAEIERLHGGSLTGLGLPFTSDPVSLAVSPDGRFVVAGTKLVDDGQLIGGHLGGEVCVWNLEKRVLQWRQLKTHTDAVYAVAFSPDSKTLATAGGDKLIRIWNVQTGELIATLFGAAWNGISTLEYSPDGKFLASGGIGDEDGGAVRIWEVNSGKMLRRHMPFRRGSPVRVAFAPDGRLFAVGPKKGTVENQFQVHAWDPKSGQDHGLFADGSGTPRTAVFSTDGRFAIGTYEGNLLLFNKL